MAELVLEATGDRFSRDRRRGEPRATRRAQLGCDAHAAPRAGARRSKRPSPPRSRTRLIQPIHVTGFPRDISPLAKADRGDPRLAERFETYVNGWEVANAFSELNDPLDQRARFEAQMQARAAGDEEAQPLDEDFVVALEYGMPPAAGSASASTGW